MRTILACVLFGLACGAIDEPDLDVLESDLTTWNASYSDANGWNAAQYGSTIAYPDLNGDGLADVCGRGTGGVWCGLSNGTSFAGPTLWTTSFTDGTGWAVAPYYSTIEFPDVNADGKADICGRGVGGVWCALSTGTGFGTVTQWTTGFSDAEGWNAAVYYSTITFPDLNGDRKRDICGRGPAGIFCALSTGTSFSNFSVWSTMMSDAAGWNAHQYYSTIKFQDLDNDGRADVCGRGVAGVYCALSTGSSFGSFSLWSAVFSDANQWNQVSHYATISFPDLDGDHRADICGRGTAGIHCALSSGTSFGSVGLWTSAFSNASGGNLDSTYATISYPDLNGDGLADTCGRTSSGMSCATSTGNGFSNLASHSTIHSDAAGWNVVQRYSTITFADVDADGRADVCHRDASGVACEPSSAPGRWTATRSAIDGAVPTVRGITVAAVKNGTVVFTRGAGMANTTTPAAPDITFQIASVSKLFIGTAVMHAVEQSVVALDQTTGLANAALSPAVQPTLRQFAAHNAGMQSQVCYSIGNFEPSSNLANETACVTQPPTWTTFAPGTHPDYSNISLAWVARFVEQRTGLPFDQFTRVRIFEPLMMKSTGWFRNQFANPNRLAIGFDAAGNPTNDLGVTPYPMGNLRASVLDLARFMIMWTSGGVAPNGQRVLQESSVTAAFPPNENTVGVSWFPWKTLGNRLVFSHGGRMPGVCTRLSIDPSTRTGVVILTNGHCDLAGPHINAIEHAAFQALDL